MEEFKAKDMQSKDDPKGTCGNRFQRRDSEGKLRKPKSGGRRINEADFVCTIIWYCTQYMNYIILGIAEFMLVGVLAAGAFVLALESEVRNWQC